MPRTEPAHRIPDPRLNLLDLPVAVRNSRPPRPAPGRPAERRPRRSKANHTRQDSTAEQTTSTMDVTEQDQDDATA